MSVSAPQPRQVLLFSGHIMDAPERPQPRFPPGREPAVARSIGLALDALGAGPADIGFTQGAAGADLLLAEAALARGVRMHLLLPFPQDEFIRRSVLPASNGEHWRARFHAVVGRLAEPPQVLAADPGATSNPYARCNLWLLDSALAYGAERVKLVCVWNGEDGDGDGGTAHMVAAVRRQGGEVVAISP